MTNPDSVAHEAVMAAFTELSHLIERQQQNGQTTTQNGAQGQK